MILDERNEFFTSLLIPQTATTTLMGDVIDLQTSGIDLGGGQPIYWYLYVDIAAAGGTSAQFLLQSGTDASLSGAYTHIITPAYSVASLSPAGRTLYIGAIPSNSAASLRYLGVNCITVGTFSGSGAVTSGLSLDTRALRYYPMATS